MCSSDLGKDIRFIRYEPQDKPVVEAVREGGKSVLRVTVTDYVGKEA